MCAAACPRLWRCVVASSLASFWLGTQSGSWGSLVLAGVLVLVSAGGLLYQINSVIHKLHTDQHIEGAYLITLSVLVLFWNILVLLMRLNRR